VKPEEGGGKDPAMRHVQVASGVGDDGAWRVQVLGDFGLVDMNPGEARAYADALELAEPDLAPISETIRKMAARCERKGIDA
jgi:hypothetical protein